MLDLSLKNTKYKYELALLQTVYYNEGIIVMKKFLLGWIYSWMANNTTGGSLSSNTKDDHNLSEYG